jgi:hypothetical protein
MCILYRFHWWLIFARVVALFMFVWPYVCLHILCMQLVFCRILFIFGILVGHDLSMLKYYRFHGWLIFARVIALFMFVWPYVCLHILCMQLVICLLLDFIHTWYLGWPWSEHAHIIPISQIVYFSASYSPFHVCLTICPSAHLVYATSHLSFVAFYSYLVSWLAMHDLSMRILYQFQGWLIFVPTALGGFQHSLHSFMPLHHVKFHYNLILYYTSTLCRASGGIAARQRMQFHFSSSIMAQI